MDGLQKIELDQPTLEERPTTTPTTPTKRGYLVPSLLALAVLMGLGTGWYVAKDRLLQAADSEQTTGTLTQNPTSAASVKVGDTYGSADESTFRDNAEGILVAGGIEGEGSHHLERGANKSQWVYLTSSVIDLDNFQGHKVKVWGETIQGKKAGWLMDVGRLKVEELNVVSSPATTQQED